MGLGFTAKYIGNYDEARKRFTREPIFREMGDMHRTAMIRSEVAHIERHEGH